MALAETICTVKYARLFSRHVCRSPASKRTRATAEEVPTRSGRCRTPQRPGLFCRSAAEPGRKAPDGRRVPQGRAEGHPCVRGPRGGGLRPPPTGTQMTAGGPERGFRRILGARGPPLLGPAPEAPSYLWGREPYRPPPPTKNSGFALLPRAGLDRLARPDRRERTFPDRGEGVSAKGWGTSPPRSSPVLRCPGVEPRTSWNPRHRSFHPH